ncbi:VQ motif-containing protein 22-like [Telopea speciosissima]|uniref:VQ motif-containing protein 22-like n=1 Tax=Telopea speciosissima TaxID=54955 RepID=UPI001CC4A65B|nr:VQ motif-containing protein 22-like [Telopea speciosissima]
MAITDRTTMAGPNDWLQFYRRNLTGEEQPPSSPPSSSSSAMFSGVSDSPVVTSVTTPGTGNSMASTSSVQLNPEGRRVAKPNRRRSRASRRAPTTLLNTDTTNFRAMVQQFTGVPSTPFTTGPTNFNFAPATITAPGYHLQQQQHQQQQPQQQFQQQQHQQQQQQQQQFQQQQLQYMLSMNNTTSDVFRQRFSDGNQ